MCQRILPCEMETLEVCWPQDSTNNHGPEGLCQRYTKAWNRSVPGLYPHYQNQSLTMTRIVLDQTIVFAEAWWIDLLSHQYCVALKAIQMFQWVVPVNQNVTDKHNYTHLLHRYDQSLTCVTLSESSKTLQCVSSRFVSSRRCSSPAIFCWICM